MNNVAVAVCNNLKFDVMWIDDEFFEVNLIASESFFGFVTRTVKG